MKTQISALELELNTENAKRLLGIAVKVGAFMDGPVTLASGKLSDRYFDGKLVSKSAEGKYFLAKAILEDILDGIDVDFIGGMATGADPIADAVSLMSYGREKPIDAFSVRQEPKAHGTRKKIEGPFRAGAKVAIVDDVITTGDSIEKAIEAVEAANCTVVKVIVFVDRKEGGSDKLRRKGYDVTAILRYPAPGQVALD